MRPEENAPRLNFSLNVIAYCFSNGTDFWAPYPDLHYGITVSDFGKKKNQEAQYLENVANMEEFLHRRLMVATRTRFEMAWEEALSLCEMLTLLKEVRDKDFQLLVPIRHNLNVSRIPSNIKSKVEDLEKADKLLRNYLDATSPFIESSTLVYLDKLFSEIDKPRFRKRLERQSMRYPFLQKIYPSVRKAMSNYSIEIPLASIVLSPDLPRSTPPLTLPESFKHISIVKATEIENRFNRLVEKLAKVSVSSEAELSNMVVDLGFDYLNVDDLFDWLIPSYQDALDTLSSTFEEYIFEPITSPLDLAIDKLLRFEKTKENVLTEMGKSKEDMESGIFFANTLYAGTSSIHLVENLDHTTKKVDFHPNVHAKLKEQITKAAVMMFFLRVFLINGVSICPISGYFKECDRCLLFDPRRPRLHDKLEMKAICPAYSLLDKMNIRIIAS